MIVTSEQQIVTSEQVSSKNWPREYGTYPVKKVQAFHQHTLDTTHTGLLLHFYYYFFGSHSQVFRLARSYSNHYLSSVRQHPQAQ